MHAEGGGTALASDQEVAIQASSVRNRATPARPRREITAIQPQEVVLGWCGEYLTGGERAWSGGVVELLDKVGFTPGAARIALSRIVKRGLLERVRKGQRIYYTIAPRLTPMLEDGRRQTYFFRDVPKWDGNWTLVWYSIPESMRAERRRLGRRLSFLGFASLQDGTWLVPRDIRSQVVPLVRALELERYVAVIVGVAASGFDLDGPLGAVWEIEDLNAHYADFIERFAPLSGAKDLTPMESFVIRTQAIDTFRQLATLDPRLPADLMPSGWRQPEAIQVFDRLTRELYGDAKRYFDEICRMESP